MTCRVILLSNTTASTKATRFARSPPHRVQQNQQQNHARLICVQQRSSKTSSKWNLSSETQQEKAPSSGEFLQIVQLLWVALSLPSRSTNTHSAQRQVLPSSPSPRGTMHAHDTQLEKFHKYS